MLGKFKINLDKYEFKYFRHVQWLKVMFQDITNKQGFDSIEEAQSINHINIQLSMKLTSLSSLVIKNLSFFLNILSSIYITYGTKVTLHYMKMRPVKHKFVVTNQYILELLIIYGAD